VPPRYDRPPTHGEPAADDQGDDRRHAESAGARTVVAAAIIRSGRVLAARRRAPIELAGRWEFPGGKVELDESEKPALVRECREELGVLVAVESLWGRSRIRDHLELALYGASLITGEPSPGVAHDVLRWLTSAELADVDWLEADLELLTVVGDHMPRGR
jgi:8-oxo-dGTP diphosphatase